MQDEPVYETVWNGGPGLTTYGAQRPGAVLQDVKEGDVTQWIALQQYDATHPRRAPNLQTDSFAFVTVYDTAYVAQPAYRVAVARLAASWSRVLAYARYGGWPSCQLCGLAMPTYDAGFKRGMGRERRQYATPRHRAVCGACYVRYRMARGRWAGVDGLAAWRAGRWGTLTAQDRLGRRRAAQAAYYRRRKAAQQQTPAATLPAAPDARTGPAA